MEEVVGFLAMLSSLYAILVGLTCQAWSNYRRKSVKGLSINFLVSILVLYILWMFYGLVKSTIDYYLVVPNALGIVIASIIFVQFFVYRKR